MIWIVKLKAESGWWWAWVHRVGRRIVWVRGRDWGRGLEQGERRLGGGSKGDSLAGSRCFVSLEEGAKEEEGGLDQGGGGGRR